MNLKMLLVISHLFFFFCFARDGHRNVLGIHDVNPKLTTSNDSTTYNYQIILIMITRIFMNICCICTNRLKKHLKTIEWHLQKKT